MSHIEPILRALESEKEEWEGEPRVSGGGIGGGRIQTFEEDLGRLFTGSNPALSDIRSAVSSAVTAHSTAVQWRASAIQNIAHKAISAARHLSKAASQGGVSVAGAGSNGGVKGVLGGTKRQKKSQSLAVT